MNKKRKAWSLGFINKWKVACLLGLLLTFELQEIKGETLYTQGKNLPLGEVLATPDGNNTILTLSNIPVEFEITNLYLGNEQIFNNSISTTEYDRLIKAGNKFNASYSLKDISTPQNLINILNIYSPNTAVLEDGVVKISSNIDGESKTLKFVSGGSPISIYVSGDFRLSNFYWILDGGDLTLKRDESNVYSWLGELTMNAGSLSLKNASCGTLVMNSGTLILDLEGTNSLGAAPLIQTLTTNGGTIACKNGRGYPRYYMTEMTIAGDVTINSENNITNNGITEDEYSSLAEKITINSGTVIMNHVVLDKLANISQNGGNLTLSKCDMSRNAYLSNKQTTPLIMQKGGIMVLDYCSFLYPEYAKLDRDYFIEIQEGTLTINDVSISSTNSSEFVMKSFIHVTGANAKVDIKKGFLGNPRNFAAIYQEGGTVEIAGGEFPGAICIESGDLTITGGEFVLTNTSWNDYNAHIHILGNNANVSLQGGHYGGTAVYAAPGLSIQPESLLASGYGLYTWDQQWQPDVSLSADHLISGQENKHIKSLSAPSTPNNLLEAAKTASVGTEGTDVKVIVTGEGYPNWQPCELEINTAKGLAWFASGFHNLVDNGGKYRSGAEVVRLTANIDMSEYDWIPTSFTGKFDGQGHRISGLKVNQSDAAFLSSVDRDATLANLVIRGTFNSIRTDYTSSRQQAAGLCLRNDGLIINCGVQQSTVSCVTTDRTNVQVGGLVASNYGTIRNCYMTGNVTCEASHEDRSYPINYVYHHYIGGLVGDNWSGGAYNCYHADGAVNHTEANPIAALRIHKDDLVQKNESSSEVIKENCTTTPSVDALNQQVQIFNAALEGGAIAWSTWVTENGVNGGHPIHVYEKDNPSIIETQITLLVKGDGELEATYSIKNDDPNKDPIEKTIKANTTVKANITVNIRNLVEFKITAKPGKGAELVKVTHTLGNQLETELEGIVANEPSKYDVSSLSTTITAYFRTETLYVDADTPFIGGAEGEIEEVEHINILDMGYSYEPVEKELGNVKVTAKGGEGTTTIDSHSHVILNLSGTSSLGKLLNQGTVVFRKKTAEATLEVKEVMNKGTLIDETGLITEVIADTYETILSLNGSQGDQVEVGEKATLRAKATVKADEPVRFQWQLWNGTEWKDVEGGSTIYPDQIRSGSLRASTTETKTYEDEYKTGELTESTTLHYRCLIITPFRDVPEETTVSTTLTTYTKVEVTPKSDPGTDPYPTPTPSYTYYEVTLPEVTGATTNPAAGKYTVKEGDSFSFTLTLDADYDQSKPEVKAGSEVLTADANGTYTIANVPGDLTITITGIALNNPTANAEVGQTIKVWGEGTTLHIYTEKRETIRLYSFNGQLLRQMDNAGRISITNLPQGNYLIRIGSRTWKIAL